MKTLFIAIFSTLMIAGCAVSADDIETASYTTVKQDTDKQIEIRKYDPLVLVETPMGGEGRNGAFGRLFKYISGANVKQSEIPMTAPVVMDDETQNQSEKIKMTAPVIMGDKGDKKPMMSFVLPSQYTIDTAPLPTNKQVQLRELKDYNVAAIRFNGTLSDKNIQKHRDILMNWIKFNDYKITGEYRTAGYNAPFTLPWMRRNEVLIPVELK